MPERVSELTGELVVISGRYRGHRIPLADEGLRIGRDRSCGVAVDDEAASRVHSEIVRREGQFVLRDLQSTNGTYLNDARVSESPLQNGDRIGVGETVLLLQLEKARDLNAPQVVFSKDQSKPGTRFSVSVSLKDTRFLDIPEGISSPDTQRQFAHLYDFMVDAAGILHPPALLERSLDHFFRALNADRGLILLLTPEGGPGLKATRVAPGVTSQTITVAQTMANQLLQKKESFLSVNSIPDRSGDVNATHSTIGAPLKVKDKVIGMVYFETAVVEKEFTEQDLKLCAAMAQQLAICVENTRLYTELLDAAEFNNSVLRSLGSGIMVVDRAGRILRINRATQDILGMPEMALIGHLLSEFSSLAELNQIIQNTLATGHAEDRCEATIQAGGPKQTSAIFVPLGVSTSLLADHTGRTIGAVANFRNLTNVRKLEVQVRRSQHMAALGQMAAGVAHEVRNPLNSIRGFAQLIQEMPGGTTATAEYTQTIVEEVDRMNRIIQDLLDFSRQRELTLTSVQVPELLTGLIRDMSDDAVRTGGEIVLVAKGDPIPDVLADRDKLRQVFRNIILNALQACEKDGRVSIATSVIVTPAKHSNPAESSTALSHREIAVSFTDNGTGMDPSVIAKIFDPFFTQKESGTGLGLSISQKIVEQHGGRIEVKSAPGKGSTFTVILPAI